MNFYLKYILACFLLTTVLLSKPAPCQVRQENGQSNDMIILGDKNIIKETDALSYIGEIRGRSYIKMNLEPLEKTGKKEDSDVIHYKGAYYEAASDKTYSVYCTYDASSQTWEIKCYNSRRQYVSNFHGRETSEGVIEGTWKNKHQTCSFYLLEKGNRN